MSRLLAPLAALVAALGLVMAWLVLWHLMPAAGGQLPFDFRQFGYDLRAVREYLEALDGTGRAVYLVEMRWVDGAFAVALGLLLGLLTLRVSAGWPAWRRGLFLLPALGFAALDLREDALVAELLRAGPLRYSADVAALASDVTLFKHVFLALAVLGILGIWRFRRDT